MFHNPNEGALLQSVSGMESVIAPEPSSLMIPVVGPTGEIMYYLPAPNGRMPLSAGHQMPLRLDQQQQFPSFLQQPQQAQASSDTLLMRSISGGLMPLCGNTTSSYAPALEPTATHQHFLQGCFPGGQHHHGALAHKSIFLQQNMETRDVSGNVEERDCGVPGVQTKHVGTPVSGIVLPKECNQVTEAPGERYKEKRALTQTITTSTFMHTTEKIDQPPDRVALTNLGPVEKAVFQQALYNQTKKLNPGKNGKGDQVKVQSDSHLRSKKHSRTMFDGVAGKDKVVVSSTSTSQSVYSPRLKQPADNCQSADNTNASHDSRAAKRDDDATVAATKGKSDTRAPDVSTVPTTTQQLSRSAVLPAIRYHPYIRSQDATKSITVDTENAIAQKKDVPVPGETNSSEIPSGNEGSSNEKNCFQPSIHVPTSSTQASNVGAVHSVTVPKLGSYKLSTQARQPSNGAHPVDETVNTSSDASEQFIIDTNVDVNKARSQSSESPSTEEVVAGTDTELQTDNNTADAAGTPQGDKDDQDTATKNRSSPMREVNLPDPLPSYITKIDRPPGRVLKESLHCTTCDIYVNSDNQMKQHLSSLRHKNTLQGIPTPPKPGREEKPKPKSEQYKCNICKVTLNSDIQLSQHLASQRHKNILEGKPPKPRWTPYERNQQVLLRSAAALRLPFKSGAKSSILNAQQGLSLANAAMPVSLSADFAALGASPLAGHYLTAPSGATGTQAAHLKQASFVLSEGGLLQAREIVYVGTPSVQAFQPQTSYPSSIATLPGMLPGQAQLQLPQVLAAPSGGGFDWSATGLRLAS